MQIEQRTDGRVIVIEGADYPLPKLAAGATVNVWQKGPGDYQVFTQPVGQPEEIPAAIGYAKIASLELEADQDAAIIDARKSMTLTTRQARLALNGIGKLVEVPAAIAALPEPQKTNAEIEWEYASRIERSNPLVAVLAEALQLTDKQVDRLFIDWATL